MEQKQFGSSMHCKGLLFGFCSVTAPCHLFSHERSSKEKYSDFRVWVYYLQQMHYLSYSEAVIVQVRPGCVCVVKQCSSLRLLCGFDGRKLMQQREVFRLGAEWFCLSVFIVRHAWADVFYGSFQFKDHCIHWYCTVCYKLWNIADNNVF